MENDALFINTQENTRHRYITGKIGLVQFCNTNGQQINSNNNNSTFNNAQLTSSHCRQNSKAIIIDSSFARYLYLFRLDITSHRNLSKILHNSVPSRDKSNISDTLLPSPKNVAEVEGHWLDIPRYGYSEPL
ncbi:hypothetical protein AVEN_60946-1 [Araneus ventricosus]|uniref:Uncharacterized protein n=1 Tax=Araneus ventricosus TaxID=182803 RepID=A0A4Y2DDB1_ARAVE|nr:hypothetical protein AVEN_60946-1 [Araneus ventricosus]